MGALGPDGCISQFSDVDLRGGFGLTLTACLVSVDVYREYGCLAGYLEVQNIVGGPRMLGDRDYDRASDGAGAERLGTQGKAKDCLTRCLQ